MATTVAGAFTEFQARLALTPNQRTIAAGRLANLKIFFTTNYQVATEPWAIGSYGRDTIVRPERDIDIMVALSVDPYWARYQNDSRVFLRWLRDGLNRLYPNTRVGVRQIAVHLALGENLEVDLVGGFHAQGGGFWIPNGAGGWQKTNPPFHDKLMTDSNVRLGGHLKPLVRVMKGWNIVGNASRLRSFHLEMMVEGMWRNATSLPAMPEAVAATLKAGAGWVRAAHADPWSASGQNLDSYLTATARASSAKAMDDDAVRAAEAIAYVAAGQTAKAVERWDIVFGHQFPAYG
jgi:Second Messenger Oligonucleotide or Dinucleotide Synthetase domain